MKKQALTIPVFYELKSKPNQSENSQSRFTYKTGYYYQSKSSQMLGAAASFDAMIHSIHKHDDLARFNLDVIQVNNLEYVRTDQIRSPFFGNIEDAELSHPNENEIEQNNFRRDMSEKHGGSLHPFSGVKRSLIINRIMIPARLIEDQEY